MPETPDRIRVSSSSAGLAARRRWPAFRPEYGLGLLLIALTFAVYGRALRFGFVSFDDPRYVTDNFYVLSGLSLRGLRWAFTTFHDCNWIPLTWLSLMLDATLYGRWAGGFHLTNILLHQANVLLVFFVFRRATGQTWQSAFVAALFAIHPLHVESVVWITERKDVLSIFFGLLSLSSYVRYAQGGRLLWFAAAFVSLTCSLAAKQTLVTLPFVFLLVDFWPLGRFAVATNPAVDGATASNRPRRITRLFAEKIPFFALSALFCAIVLFAQSRGRAVQPLAAMPLATRVANAILVYGVYLEKALFPFGLAIFYPHPGAQISLLGVAGSFAVLTAVTAAAIARARRYPFAVVGWLWFIGTLVPMIGLVQVGRQQMADRYAYFPNLGLYMAVAWLAPALVSGMAARRWALPAIASATVAIYAAIAFAQLGYWQDGITLMRHSLAVTGENSFAGGVLAEALLAESRVDEALEQYQRNIDRAPGEAGCHVSLGSALYNLKRFDAAAGQFRAALKIDERNDAAHSGLALALCGKRDYVHAQREFFRSLQIEKINLSAYAGLSQLFRALGDYEQSIVCAERALKVDDTLPFCQRLLAIKLLDQGRPEEAIDCWRQLAAVWPQNAEFRAELERAEAMNQDRAGPAMR